MEPKNKKNEYVEIYLRGTGARNHNSSIIKVDNNVLFDHGATRGLYLVVLSRKNLQRVWNETFDLQKREVPYLMNNISIVAKEVCVTNSTVC
jgi:hypothetical protein